MSIFIFVFISNKIKLNQKNKKNDRSKRDKTGRLGNI